MKQSVVNIFEVAKQRRSNSAIYRFDDKVYSKRLGHYICRCQLVGTKHFFMSTATEILNDRALLEKFSHVDVLLIKEIAEGVELTQKRLRVVELAMNGTVLFEDYKGKQTRYANSVAIADETIVKRVEREQLVAIAYRAGYLDGESAQKKILSLSKENIKNKFAKLNPFKSNK